MAAPSPSAGKPVAEVRYEAPLVSKPKTPRSLNKVERPSHSASVQQRVALSTVSMQNNNKDNSEDNKTDSLTAGKKLSVKNEMPAPRNNMKIERSRTTISGRDWNKKGKYSNVAQHRNENEARQTSKSHDLSDQVKKDRSRPNTNDRDPVSASVPNRKAKIVDETINNKQDLQIISKDRDSLKLTSANTFRERSSRGHSSFDPTRGRDERKGFRDLPKPAPPSQKYLEGQPMQGLETPPWGHRSMLSPKSSKESLDSEWLTQVKRYDVLVFPCSAHSIPNFLFNVTNID